MSAPIPHARPHPRHGALFWTAWVALPMLALAFQITAKLSAEALSGHTFNLTWFGLIIEVPAFRWMIAFEIASFVAWMYVLSEMPLSQAFPLSAVSYILIILASWIVFHEPGSAAQVLGSFSILSGIWLISRSDDGAGA